MNTIKIIWFTFFKHSIYDSILNSLAQKEHLKVIGVLAKDTNDNSIKYSKIIVQSSNILFPITFLKYIPDFKTSHCKLSADILLINYYSSIRSYQIYRFAKRYNIKLVTCTEEKKRSSIIKKILFGLWDHTVGKKILKYSSLVMPWTADSRNFITNLVDNSKKIVQISPGIDTSFFFPDPERNYLAKGVLNILMVAKFEKNKDHVTLLKAIKLLLNDRMLKFKLTLVGRDSGGIKSHISKKITDLKLNEYVNILDPVSKDGMRKLYNEHDLLILPSTQEPVGMVVPEALACGTPVIASDRVGAKSFIDSEKNGYVFEAGSYKDLSLKIIKAFHSNLENMGNHASNSIRNNYSIDIMADKISTAISKIS